MPAVNGVGEPCAGEPHARFEAAGAGNGADLIKGTGVAQPAGKPAEHEGPRPYRQQATAPAPDPTSFHLTDLEDVDGLGQLPGPLEAAAEFTQDAPGFELGIGAFTGSAELGVATVGSLLRGSRAREILMASLTRSLARRVRFMASSANTAPEISSTVRQGRRRSSSRTASASSSRLKAPTGLSDRPNWRPDRRGGIRLR
jgi:hypothetical protein